MPLAPSPQRRRRPPAAPEPPAPTGTPLQRTVPDPAFAAQRPGRPRSLPAPRASHRGARNFFPSAAHQLLTQQTNPRTADSKEENQKAHEPPPGDSRSGHFPSNRHEPGAPQTPKLAPQSLRGQSCSSIHVFLSFPHFGAMNLKVEPMARWQAPGCPEGSTGVAGEPSAPRGGWAALRSGRRGQHGGSSRGSLNLLPRSHSQGHGETHLFPDAFLGNPFLADLDMLW